MENMRRRSSLRISSFLEDEEFIGQAIAQIRAMNVNAEYALHEVTEQLVAIFAGMDDEYLRERAADFRDVSKRVQRHLSGAKAASLNDFAEAVVLIANDLTPSDTAQLDRTKVAGFVTQIGGRTSHSAIMARSMEIPAVVGLTDAMHSVKTGQMVIVDGSSGIVLIDPDAETLAAYREKKEKFELRREEMKQYKDRPSVTADGHQVELVANIGNPQDALGARNHGAEGVGLFRTEFLYMGRDNFLRKRSSIMLIPQSVRRWERRSRSSSGRSISEETRNCLTWSCRRR